MPPYVVGAVVAVTVTASAGDVLEMSVMRGLGGVCDTCMCLARAGWEVLGVIGFIMGLTNPGGTWGNVSVLVAVVWVVLGGGLQWVVLGGGLQWVVRLGQVCESGEMFYVCVCVL